MVFLEISQSSQEKTCARVSFQINFIKKRLWHRLFPVNFAKFIRTPFLTEHLRWQLLNNHSLAILTLSILLSLIYIDQIIQVHGYCTLRIEQILFDATMIILKNDLYQKII